MLELFVHSEELFSFLWFSMLNCFSLSNGRKEGEMQKISKLLEQSLKNDESENNRDPVDAGWVAYAGASEDQTKLLTHVENLPKGSCVVRFVSRGLFYPAVKSISFCGVAMYSTFRESRPCGKLPFQPLDVPCMNPRQRF